MSRAESQYLTFFEHPPGIGQHIACAAAAAPRICPPAGGHVQVCLLNTGRSHSTTSDLSLDVAAMAEIRKYVPPELQAERRSCSPNFLSVRWCRSPSACAASASNKVRSLRAAK